MIKPKKSPTHYIHDPSGRVTACQLYAHQGPDSYLLQHYVTSIPEYVTCNACMESSIYREDVLEACEARRKELAEREAPVILTHLTEEEKRDLSDALGKALDAHKGWDAYGHKLPQRERWRRLTSLAFRNLKKLR